MNQKEKTQSRVFVPLSHFTEKSFLNMEDTMISTDTLGSSEGQQQLPAAI